MKANVAERRAQPRMSPAYEPPTRFGVLYRCPNCGGFSVHTANRATLRRNLAQGSKKVPLRTFCPAPLGVGTCTTNRGGNGRGRGFTQVRIRSGAHNHGYAATPLRGRPRLNDVAEALNMTIRAGDMPDEEMLVEREVNRTIDPSWRVGLDLPHMVNLWLRGRF